MVGFSVLVVDLTRRMLAETLTGSGQSEAKKQENLAKSNKKPGIAAADISIISGRRNAPLPAPTLTQMFIWTKENYVFHYSCIVGSAGALAVIIWAVESESREVGKSLKIGKNRIKSEKSDLISYPTFRQKCQNAINCRKMPKCQGPASEYLNI